MMNRLSNKLCLTLLAVLGWMHGVAVNGEVVGFQVGFDQKDDNICNPGQMRKINDIFKEVANAGGFVAQYEHSSNWKFMATVEDELDDIDKKCTNNGNGNAYGLTVNGNVKVKCPDRRLLLEEDEDAVAEVHEDEEQEQGQRRLQCPSYCHPSLYMYTDCSYCYRRRRNLRQKDERNLEDMHDAMISTAVEMCELAGTQIPCIDCSTAAVDLHHA